MKYTYDLMKQIIEKDEIDTEDIKQKLVVFHTFGTLTAEEYEELYMMIDPDYIPPTSGGGDDGDEDVGKDVEEILNIIEGGVE